MTKKTLTYAMIVLLSMALCGAAAAARKKFTDFSLDVPAGWTSSEHTDDKGAKTAVLVNRAKKITLMIGMEGLGGKNTKAKAEEFAKLVGSKVENLGEGVFSVTFQAEGGKTKAIIIDAEDGKNFLGIAITGNENDPEVAAIIDSLDD